MVCDLRLCEIKKIQNTAFLSTFLLFYFTCSLDFFSFLQIVPGQGHALLEVSFTPPSFVKDEQHYLGYALGYMSLMNKV